MPAARVTALAAALLTALACAPVAHAAWSHSGAGTPTTRAFDMPSGNTPTVSVSNRDATVSWSMSMFSGGASVAGYVVRRYDSGGTAQTIGAGCSGTVGGTSCTETSLPSGTWRYTVTPKQGNWTGAESAKSAAAVVASPALSLSSATTVTSLPATLTGSISGYLPGQTVAFRLDDPSSGPSLTGTITPGTVPSSGNATLIVTLPAGTANGSHTIYAVGSSGDTAGTALTTAVTYTVTSSGWSFTDASSGTATDASAPYAFAGDGLTFATGSWSSSFATTRYVDFDMASPLPGGLTASGAAFKLNFAAGAAADTACFWFEVRRASTGAVIGTHGSSSTPVACVNGTTLQASSTTLPELATSDLADDARVRVYMRETGAKPVTVDLATVTGSTSAAAFTLYPTSYNDASTGTASANPWPLAAGSDGATYNSAANWGAFGSARYLSVTFPAYVPSTASTITAATFTTSFRPNRNGNNACYWAEVYSGATLIGTRGSSTTAYSCNSSSTYKTDAIPLPEVTTAARANGLSVRLYFSVTGGGNKTTDTDLASLSVSYQ